MWILCVLAAFAVEVGYTSVGHPVAGIFSIMATVAVAYVAATVFDKEARDSFVLAMREARNEP